MNYELFPPPIGINSPPIALRRQPTGITACATQISDISFLVDRVQGAAVAGSGVTG